MKKVLVCDDVRTDRELVGAVVKKVGFDVEYAEDGEEAIVKTKQVKPVLVLMDVVMPKSDGFSTCRKIKKDPETAHIPVVLVTSKSTEADKFWGQKQGADDHIAKPFSPEALEEIIKKYAG